MHKERENMHESPQPALRISGAGAYAAPCGRDFPVHQHLTWELVYYRTGHILCPIGDREYQAQPGMLLLTPPRISHAEKARTAYSNYYLAVEAPEGCPWPRVCFDDPDRSLEYLCRTVVKEWHRPSPDRGVMLALLAAQLAIFLARFANADRMSEAERLVTQVEALMQERQSSSPTLLALAHEVGASPSAIRAAFAQVKGHSPTHHRQQMRLAQALALLRSSTLTLESIAGLCGYHSASHLSRHIQQETGESPGRLRASADLHMAKGGAWA